jgi:hypothetical protein
MTEKQMEVLMVKEWSELTRITGGDEINVERVRIARSGIAIEGDFTLPPLAQLPPEDQVFVMAFVGAHGSIKDMERLFGISYPTVKNRLDRLASRLKMVEVGPQPEPAPEKEDVLEALERGEITPDEALRRLS